MSYIKSKQNLYMILYKLYPVKRTLEKNQLLVPRFMGSFFDIL